MGTSRSFRDSEDHVRSIADVAMKFAIKKLHNADSNLSKRMCLVKKKRYKERPLIEASVMRYLANKDSSNLQTDDLDLFSRPNSDEMCDKIVDLLGHASNIEQSDLHQDYLEPQKHQLLAKLLL